MSSLVAPPRTTFPWDILLLVFEQSEDSTLAVLGRVSLDVLAATSTILYGDGVVEITTAEALELLFCERVESTRILSPEEHKPSRINPYLSLSQLKHLHVDFSSFTRDDVPPFLRLSSSRMEVSNPLPLHTFKLCCRVDSKKLLTILHTALLPRLNPLQLAYDVASTLSPFILIHGPRLSQWNRIQTISFRGSLHFVKPSASSNYSIAALPKPTADGRRTLRVHVATLPNGKEHPIVQKMEEVWSDLGLDTMQRGSVVLVVNSEEMKSEVEAGIRGCDQEWVRDRFVVELEI